MSVTLVLSQMSATYLDIGNFPRKIDVFTEFSILKPPSLHVCNQGCVWYIMF